MFSEAAASILLWLAYSNQIKKEDIAKYSPAFIKQYPKKQKGNIGLNLFHSISLSRAPRVSILFFPSISWERPLFLSLSIYIYTWILVIYMVELLELFLVQKYIYADEANEKSGDWDYSSDVYCFLIMNVLHINWSLCAKNGVFECPIA